MRPSSIDEDLRLLGQLLWRYRRHLEQIEYLLDVQHLLVVNGRDRWVGRVVDSLEATSQDLAALDLERSELLGRLGLGLGLTGPIDLRRLVEHAPEPWGDMLADHLRWFTQQTTRIAEASRQARTSVTEGLAGVQELLRGLRGASESGYDHGGRALVAAASTPLLFDDRA